MIGKRPYTVIGIYKDNGQRCAFHVQADGETEEDAVAKAEEEAADLSTFDFDIAGVLLGHHYCLDDSGGG